MGSESTFYFWEGRLWYINASNAGTIFDFLWRFITITSTICICISITTNIIMSISCKDHKGRFFISSGSCIQWCEFLQYQKPSECHAYQGSGISSWSYFGDHNVFVQKTVSDCCRLFLALSEIVWNIMKILNHYEWFQNSNQSINYFGTCTFRIWKLPRANWMTCRRQWNPRVFAQVVDIWDLIPWWKPRLVSAACSLLNCHHVIRWQNNHNHLKKMFRSCLNTWRITAPYIEGFLVMSFVKHWETYNDWASRTSIQRKFRVSKWHSGQCSSLLGNF